MTDEQLTLLRQELIEDEGRRLRPYRCPTGHLTVGVGRNLDANGLRDDEVDLMLSNDIADASEALDRIDPGWREHPPEVQRALVNLVFNMGADGWLKFFNTRAALRRRDYEAAAKGLLASKWATQVQKSRRDRIVAQIRGGHHERAP